MTPLLTTSRDKLRNRLSSVLLAPVPAKVDESLMRMSRRFRAKTLASVPPGSQLQPVDGDAGFPFIGHTLDYIRFGSDFTRDRYKRFGAVSWMGVLGIKLAVVAGPAATQEALTNKDKALSQDGWTFLIDKFFHRGLMLMSFDEHLMHRRIMQEAFSRDRLGGYVEQITPRVRQGIATWSTDQPTRVYPLLKQLTLDVATDVFMGGRGGEDAETINQAFVATVRAASSIVRAPLPGTRYRAGVKARQVLEDYFFAHLPTARASEGWDLFAGLCQAETPDGESFTDEDVVSHMIFLMMAAHDTSTITTAAAAYFLAKNPAWQAKARSESDALGDTEPDIEALESLGTLDLVIKETLRMAAPVPIVMRKAIKDATVAGHHIPEGTLVAVAPAVNHFDPDCWIDPDTFDPDRFGPERREDKSHRGAWIPFGSGVHKCIGLHFGTLEVKAILHEMLRTYTWAVPENYEVRWDNTSLPVPVDGLPITFSPRVGNF